MNFTKTISCLLLVNIAFSSCDGFNWFAEFEIEACDAGDISVIRTLVSQSEATIELDMDVDFDGEIDPLEVGWQFWEDGRLVHWICSDAVSYTHLTLPTILLV